MCIIYLTESSASLLVGACECAHIHVVFPGLCVCSSSTHTKDTWPSITVCLPLRQQMFQPCLNSLAVLNQTVSLGPWGLTHLHCSQHPILQLIMLSTCTLTLHWIFLYTPLSLLVNDFLTCSSVTVCLCLQAYFFVVLHVHKC